MLVTMKVLGANGHTEVVCDTEAQQSTEEHINWEEFERQFNSYVGEQRHVAFRQPADGSPGERIEKLSDLKPQSGDSLIVFPQIAGG